jgi:mRNA-degrading endonuclease RelE of RelBE toxin-antitoxin system
MSTSLLEKLKVKPVPKKIEQIKVKIVEPAQQEKVEIQTILLDKTKDKLINRSDFLQKLKMPVSSKIPEKIAPVPITPTAIKKVKKLPKKLKLVVEKGMDELPEPEDRRTIKPKMDVIADDIDMEKIIGDSTIIARLPPKENKVLLKANAYYMNNREIFINYINALFRPYKEEIDKMESTISCDRPDDAKFVLLTHQKIVRDYLNLYTPYRGLLLYHGLGSGKTCSSIAIAEGMKTNKQIVVMTPASLRMNYLQELKNCGDTIYKKNQYWEFIPVISSGKSKSEKDAQAADKEEVIDALSKILSLTSDFIRKNGGAWLVNVKKPSNFNDLTTDEKKSLDLQINEMITYRYKFINYNGLRNSHLKDLTRDYSVNPFDDKVVIVDEAHNFVSRIVNKMKRPESISMRLYEYLLSAQNCKIVLLTGTPMINYPNEIAILFNILRGYIKTWTFPLNIKSSRKINKEELLKMFEPFNMLDYLDYKPSSKLLTVTRNPFGFANVQKEGVYKGVSNSNVKNRGDLTDVEFVRTITSILNKNEIDVIANSIQVDTFKALEDNLESFQNRFIDPNTGNIKNENLFKRRILGLTSYFRSAQEQLMPEFNKDTDFKVIKIPMSNFQFGVYEQARIQERKIAKSAAKKKLKQVATDVYTDTVSSYRIFSRAFCNFVFPENRRPMPKEGEDIESVLKGTADEDILDAISVRDRLDNPDGLYGADDIDLLENELKSGTDSSYAARIQTEMKYLKDNADKYLTPKGLEIYSPKFLNVLENLKDPDFRGLHLIYTQFRTIEGIGVLKLILDANGFTQFKIKKDDADIWRLAIPEDKRGMPTYALYTGTETDEEKEIIRNIYNSNWSSIPDTITSEISIISTNNLYGEIIKTLMITASGAEGISLKNTRYVHIIEPYWHPVRVEQVIGRARRICSHQELPPALRTVNVFLYLMTFTKEQLSGDGAVELKLNDVSKFDDTIPVTSDETLYEISTIKERISQQLLTSVKESSMDCAIYNKPGTTDAIKCFTFGKASPSSFSYKPSISNEEVDTVTERNKGRVTWKADEVTIPIDGIKKKFALNPQTKEVYDLQSYNDATKFGSDLILVGKLVEKPNGKFEFVTA